MRSVPAHIARPPYADTGEVNRWNESRVKTPEIIERMRKDFAEWIPAGRVAHTDEMIGPAVFLASDESGYVNGATLVADGGYSHNLVRYRP
jgi:NAD(P)-dependent dehydrogenase (short-subunit alcohol dehydrogenase family)